jgi:ABC-type lipoprotein release transport system permease subunit
MKLRWLPFEYAVRNLGRRPVRTLLAGGSNALVAALLAATAAFVGGLDRSLVNAGRDDVAILLSRVSDRDVLRSTVAASLGELVAAEVRGLARPGGVPAVSEEIHMGTNLRLVDESGRVEAGHVHPVFVRGITERALLVHDVVTLEQGRVMGPGEVLVGRLVAKQLGLDPARLAPGRKVAFEGGTFTVAGTFAAPGTTIESELFAPLVDLRSLARREDSSVVFARLESPQDLEEVELFARRRLDLELNAMPSTLYYKELSHYFRPLRSLAWVLALLMGAAALLGGVNVLHSAVQDRGRELATLRAIGYPTSALWITLLQESALLGALGGLLGLALARLALRGGVVRMNMGSFELTLEPRSALVGLLGVLLLAIAGAIPAAWKCARANVAVALKET